MFADPRSVARTVSLALPITYTRFVVMVTPIKDPVKDSERHWNQWTIEKKAVDNA